MADPDPALKQWAAQSVGDASLVWTEVRRAPWSIVWRAASEGGGLWLKRSVLHRHEGAVHAALAEIAPDAVAAPVCWNHSRGWMVTPDGGRTLADVLHGALVAADLVSRSAMLADFARLQQSTLDAREALLGAGLPDRPPSRAGERLSACLTEMARYPADDPRHLAADEVRRLDAAVAVLERIGTELEAGPVPLAFDHNDLSLSNVFSPRAGQQQHRFFDVAESMWAHPFGSLLPQIWGLIHRLGLDNEPPLDLTDSPVRLVVDDYLQHWTQFAELPELRHLAQLALRVAPLHRAEVWLNLLRGHPNAVERHGSTPRSWILDVVHPVRL